MSNLKHQNSKKVNEMSFIIDKVNDKQFTIILKSLKKSNWTTQEIKQLERMYAFKNNIVYASKGDLQKASITKIYDSEIQKILFILNNEKAIKDINGLRVLFYGDTGTGKTTLVKKIADFSKKYKFENLYLEELVSSRMGQTQLNLINLVNDLNQKYENQKAIIFIDEFDSIITSRDSSNEVGEHHRIVATFIKFLDLLSENIVLFCSTNSIARIDKALIRRFNLKIEGKKIDKNLFFELFFFENAKLNYSKRLISDVLSTFEKSFTISQLDDFQKHIRLEKNFINNLDVEVEFCIFFKNYLNLKKEMFSNRLNQKLKKRGFDEKL